MIEKGKSKTAPAETARVKVLRNNDILLTTASSSSCSSDFLLYLVMMK